MASCPTSPMNNIVNTKAWLHHPDLRLLREDNYLVRPWLDAWRQEICSWQIKDFHHFYSQPNCKPLFSSLPLSFDQKYYTVPESLKIINELLLFQFGTRDEIKVFLADLYSVLDRKNQKCNCILVHSPPSAGKNFFFDLVVDYFWSKGQLGNPNKMNQFAYQEAPGKRILLWNEPNYHSEEEDMLKMILGGDNYTVRVKNKMDVAVGKTPVIVLTNRFIQLMREEAFKDRVHKYFWSRCPKLKQYTKKPNPLVFIPLLLHWGILTSDDLAM